MVFRKWGRFCFWIKSPNFAFVKKILLSLMMLTFLAGQVNLAWAMHYCGEELVASELTVDPDSHDCCGDESETTPDCCEDQISQADSDDHFQKSELKQSISPEFVLAYVLTWIGSFEADVESARGDFYYADIPIPDLQILHQTFLI